MQKKLKIILWILIAIYYFGWSFAPGSYTSAEIYEINLP